MSGIDGVIDIVIEFCRGCEGPVTVLIGDVPTLYDLNTFQQLWEVPPSTIAGRVKVAVAFSPCQRAHTRIKAAAHLEDG